MNHRERHPQYVDGCWACKALTVSVASRSDEVRAIQHRDDRLSVDLDAYKRLRRDGLQPKTIDGSGELEKRVESQTDIHLGRYVPKHERSRVEEAMQISRDLGYITEAGR